MATGSGAAFLGATTVSETIKDFAKFLILCLLCGEISSSKLILLSGGVSFLASTSLRSVEEARLRLLDFAEVVASGGGGGGGCGSSLTEVVMVGVTVVLLRFAFLTSGVSSTAGGSSIFTFLVDLDKGGVGAAKGSLDGSRLAVIFAGESLLRDARVVLVFVTISTSCNLSRLTTANPCFRSVLSRNFEVASPSVGTRSHFSSFKSGIVGKEGGGAATSSVTGVVVACFCGCCDGCGACFFFFFTVGNPVLLIFFRFFFKVVGLSKHLSSLVRTVRRPPLPAPEITIREMGICSSKSIVGSKTPGGGTGESNLLGIGTVSTVGAGDEVELLLLEVARAFFGGRPLAGGVLVDTLGEFSFFFLLDVALVVADDVS